MNASIVIKMSATSAEVLVWIVGGGYAILVG
jgi:hypothetical protein